jgi:hypothetical protein
MASGLTKPYTTGSSSATRLRASERPWTCEMRSLRSAAAGNARERRPSERRKNPTSGRLRASDSTTVATAFVSADADYDNGVTLHDAAQRRRGHEHAAKRVETSIGEKYRPDLIPVAHQRESRGGTTKSGPLEYKMGKQCAS